jgi:hypothetical protein
LTEKIGCSSSAHAAEVASSFSHYREIAAGACLDENFYHFGLVGATAILVATNLELAKDPARFEITTG